MIHRFKQPKPFNEQLNELRQLEAAAQVRFDEAKRELLEIKKKINQIQKLITPSPD